MTDVRQSPQWSKFLESIGWKSYQTSRGINIRIRKTFLGALVKIQKPVPFKREDLAEIEKICRQHKCLFIKIEPYVGQDMSIFEESGFQISWFPMTPTATFIINLELSEKQLWENISHSGKYSIKRAQREGALVSIHRNPSRDLLREFYEVLSYTGRLQKIYVPPIKQIFAQAAAFGENGFLLMVHDKDGNLCGAKWHVAHGDFVLYVSGGTSEIGRRDKSGYELVWKSILYFKSLGFKVFDLEGKEDARFPNFTKRFGGFTHFKEKFGGKVVDFPYPQIKYLNPLMKLLSQYANFNL